MPNRVSIQLNDTHPVIAIPELMRLLIDERGLDYDTAWDLTSRTFNYTCHTLLPEALERWSVGLLQYLLPRHMELIYAINKHFLEKVRTAFPMDESRVIRMSIIEEGPERMVRMAHLATVASVHVNGVAELQSQLLRDTVLHEFAELWPQRFTNVTNGVTPRRFIKLANPRLSDLITEAVGDGWLIDLEKLRGLEALADDAAFQEQWRAVKTANKAQLAALLEGRTGRVFSTDPMYDIMIKRLHEYKRQMLKLLHIATMYRRLRLDPSAAVPARVMLFGAKAAPGYQMAKLIIRLINQVGATVDADPAMAGRLAVVFPANYNVTLAERIIPAADLSEQISMAGKEASGTGNMKLSLNGALTVGTLDGANVEIRELVGEENFFLFGLTEDEVVARKAAGLQPGRGLPGRRGAAGGHRRDRHRVLLPSRRAGPVPADHREPADARRVPRAGRLPVLHRGPGEGRRPVDRPGRVDGHVDPQHGADRVLLLRPVDAGLLRAHLEVTGAPGRRGFSSGSGRCSGPVRGCRPRTGAFSTRTAALRFAELA